MPLRKCKDCGKEAETEADLALFKVHNKMKYKKDNLCKVCHKARLKIYWSEGTGRARRVEQYGISQEDYNRMFLHQNGACKICLNELPTNKKFLNIDHCHVSGKVRGLLCHNCNLGLGQFKDDVNTLVGAVIYLKGD